jgi:hypothetical protein
MWRDKLLGVLTLLLFLTGVSTISWVLLKGYFKTQEFKEVGQLSCVTEEVKTVMKDSHLNGLINKNDPIKVLKDFYNCNSVKRKDLVYFRISPPIEPAVRVVYGLPGDKFRVEETDIKNQWHLFINDQRIEVGGSPYYIQSRHTPPLKTYQASRKGVLGENEYIILSNVPPGLSDSSNLGLIKSSSFEGKVFPLGAK